MINGRRRPNIIYVPVFLLIGPACDKYWIKKTPLRRRRVLCLSATSAERVGETNRSRRTK